jgi:p-aminobenzoyl-glutamate transporter AbgT
MLQVIKEAHDNFSKVSQQLVSRGALVGNSPFMSSLIVQIILVFLAIGAAYGIGARTITSMVDGINAVTKTLTTA